MATSLSNRSTVAAIVKETTEGTPVSPSSASDDYIALQDGFSMSPSFNTLENNELTGSIASAKPILGLEEPSASLDHYLKHSGTEGTEPNFGLLFEAFFGLVETNATEYNTVGGSTAGDSTTRATVVVDAGEGATFSRGEGMLIKDGTNGYNIRCVQSVSTDTLSTNFNLANAPALGVDLGKAIFYSPANENHPTFTTWYYRSNSGAIEMMAGSRVTSMTMSATAGELLNMSFDIEGIEYFWDPIEITSSDIYLDFTDDQGTVAAIITADFYKDPHELATALTTAMNALTTETMLVEYSDSTGKFTVSTSTSAVLSLLWNTGTNTANTVGDKIGFTVASDDTGVTTYTSDSAIDLSAPQTPVYDSTDPNASKNHEIMIGDFDDYVCLDVETITATGTDTKADLLSICAASGKSGSLITERAFTVDFTLRLTQYEADFFKRFRNNDNTQFQYTFGEKSAGNWDAGKAGCLYIPTATISSYEVVDEESILKLNMTLTSYVSGGLGEVYLNFL